MNRVLSWITLSACLIGALGCMHSLEPPALVIATNGLTPAQGSVNVLSGVAVSATFNQTMLASNLASPATTFTLVPTQGGSAIAGTVSVSGATVTFQPTAALAMGTSYTATIGTAIMSAAGAKIATPITWSFTTMPALSYLNLGQAACPAEVGTYQVTAAAASPDAVSTVESSVTMPTGGTLGFSSPLMLATIGDGWATWSHGYTGDVYKSQTASGLADTLTLPDHTGAFALFLEPDSFISCDCVVTCTTADAATLQETVTIDGNAGAAGFAFYSYVSPLASVSISVPAGASGYAVGEFSIAAF